jgi:hypothetical protein
VSGGHAPFRFADWDSILIEDWQLFSIQSCKVLRLALRQRGKSFDPRFHFGS